MARKTGPSRRRSCRLTDQSPPAGLTGRPSSARAEAVAPRPVRSHPKIFELRTVRGAGGHRDPLGSQGRPHVFRAVPVQDGREDGRLVGGWTEYGRRRISLPRACTGSGGQSRDRPSPQGRAAPPERGAPATQGRCRGLLGGDSAFREARSLVHQVGSSRGCRSWPGDGRVPIRPCLADLARGIIGKTSQGCRRPARRRRSRAGSGGGRDGGDLCLDDNAPDQARYAG